MLPGPLRLVLVALLSATLLLAVGARPVSAQAGEDLCGLARDGGVEAVREALSSSKPDLEATDETGRTPLGCAIEGGHTEIVEMLLVAGARVDVRGPSGETPLHRAARLGRTEAARLLLRAGADLEARDAEERTPLYRAIESRRADAIEALQAAALAQGAGAGSRAPSESTDQTLPPRIVESTPAPYTDAAREAGVEGTVVLMVLVRRDGSVGAVSVSRGLEPSLDASARRTVREWTFAPAMRDLKTVEVVLEVEVEFRLPDGP